MGATCEKRSASLAALLPGGEVIQTSHFAPAWKAVAWAFEPPLAWACVAASVALGAPPLY